MHAPAQRAYGTLEPYMTTFRALPSRLPLWRAACALCLAALATAAWGQGLAGIRFVHLSPDAPAVDVALQDAALLQDVEYGRATGYAAAPAGERTLRVFPHRLPLTDPEQDDGEEGGDAEGAEDGSEEEEEASVRLEPITRVMNLEAGSYYTVVLSGFYEPPPEAQRSGAISLDVEPAEAEVVLEGPRGYLEEFTGDRLIDDLEGGTYELEVAAEGYAPYEQEVVVQPFRTTVVAATLQEEEGEDGGAEDEEEVADPVGEGEAEGDGAWDPVELHLFQDDDLAAPAPGHARVAIVHASPLAPPVDVTFRPETGDDEAEPVAVASRLTYPNSVEPIEVRSGQGTLVVRVANSDNRLAQIRDLTLRPGATYEFFLAPDPDDETIWVVPSVVSLLRHVR